MAEDRKSSTTIVLEAVQDLHGKEQIVTRETLAELTSPTLSVIDATAWASTSLRTSESASRGVPWTITTESWTSMNGSSRLSSRK